jgi:hypothetical protein
VDCHYCWSSVDRDAFPDSPAISGLFCATTLILRVIVAIMHDGLS